MLLEYFTPYLFLFICCMKQILFHFLKHETNSLNTDIIDKAKAQVKEKLDFPFLERNKQGQGLIG